MRRHRGGTNEEWSKNIIAASAVRAESKKTTQGVVNRYDFKNAEG